ncbi:MAG TPA: ATP synthase F1 subunit epsilon [Polyangiaceae bacterium]|nr:ATP synthase F1 subunit epsilon [Polyangiaceae bacterium]
MADTIHLEIVTPDGLKLAADVSEFTATSVDGEFGVLPGHVPLLAALAIGTVTYQIGGEKQVVAVGRGFAEVTADKALLITDRFIKKEDIDPVVVRLELKEADEALDKYEGELNGPEYTDLLARELWAAAELEVYGDPPPPRMRTLDELSFGRQQNYAALAKDSAEESDAASEQKPAH